jgi:hypothetical protein
MSTSVSRKVYERNGKLLYDDTWYSSYRADPALVRVGPPRKKQKPATSKTPPASTQTTTQPTQ